MKNFGEKGAGAYPQTAQVFWVPPIISGMGKATNFKSGRYVYRVHPSKSPLKIWKKREWGRIHGLPKFLEYPLLSQERVKLRTSNLAGIFIGFIRTKAPENLGEKGVRAYPWTAEIFGVSPIISGTGKATNFKFGRYIHRVHPNKSPLKFGEKGSVGVSMDCPNFLSTPIISGTGKAIIIIIIILSIDCNGCIAPVNYNRPARNINPITKCTTNC